LPFLHGPELLAVLKEIVAFVGDQPAGSGVFHTYKKAMEAIDKVEGCQS
jgi:hypothetical protein